MRSASLVLTCLLLTLSPALAQPSICISGTPQFPPQVTSMAGSHTEAWHFYSSGITPFWELAELDITTCGPVPPHTFAAAWTSTTGVAELPVPIPIPGTNPVWIDLGLASVSGLGSLNVQGLLLPASFSSFGLQLASLDPSAAAGVLVGPYHRVDLNDLGLHPTTFSGVLTDGQSLAAQYQPPLGDPVLSWAGLITWNQLQGLTNQVGTTVTLGGLTFDNGLDEVVTYDGDYSGGFWPSPEPYLSIGTSSWTLVTTPATVTLTVVGVPLVIAAPGVPPISFPPGTHTPPNICGYPTICGAGASFRGDWTTVFLSLIGL